MIRQWKCAAAILDGGRYSLRESVFDGDLVLVLQNEIMQEGVHRDIPIVIDVEDKAAAMVEPDTVEGRVALTMRTMKSLIGEYSNYSSAYHNKCPRSDEQKQLYEKYVDQISVLTGKAIDQAKTGIFYKMPSHIAKMGRPLPYFMKYRKEYYANQKLSMAPSNMNRLCIEMEKWHKKLRWGRAPQFDYTVMLDEQVSVQVDVYEQLREVFLAYNKEMAILQAEQRRVRAYQDEDIRAQVTKFDAQYYTVNWAYYYELYRQKCHEICPDEKMLANAAVLLQYRDYPNVDSKFMWVVAEQGLLDNIKPAEKRLLPKRDPDGSELYLGRRYSMVEVPYNEIEIQEIGEQIID